MEKLTNSPIGSRHWFNTLMGQTLRIGEFLKDKTPDETTLRAWSRSVYNISSHFIANYDKIIERSDIIFDSSRLDEIFCNVRKGKIYSAQKEHYILKDNSGDIVEFILLDQNEWRIIVDNYPGKRKLYSTNFPIETVEDFINEMLRVGIKLTLFK